MSLSTQSLPSECIDGFPLTEPPILEVDPNREQKLAELERLYSRTSPQLFRTLLGWTRDPEAALDLVQDTYERGLTNIDQFTGGNMEAWLIRIAMNKCHDQHRRNTRIKFEGGEPFEDIEAATSVTTFTLRDTGHEVVSSMYTTQYLDTICASMDKIFSEVLIAIDIEGLSYKEYSLRSKVKLGTVRTRLHRARAKLRKMYEDDGPFEKPAIFAA